MLLSRHDRDIGLECSPELIKACNLSLGRLRYEVETMSQPFM